MFSLISLTSLSSALPSNQDNLASQEILNFLDNQQLVSIKTQEGSSNVFNHSDFKEITPYSCDSTQTYRILPLPFEEKSNFYDDEQLKYIAGMAQQCMALFSKEDLIICPGRSCVHFVSILRSRGYCLATPSFSKGHNVLNVVRQSEYNDKEKKEIKQIELQDKLRQFTKDYFELKINLSNFMKEPHSSSKCNTV